MLRVERLQLDPTAIRRHALRFDTSFTDELVRVVEDDLGIALPALATERVRAAG
jgi:hypothetical protein